MNDRIAELGFGCMRLPVLVNEETEERNNGHIDLTQMGDMVDAFINAGFSYFDTARSYHDGESEGALKKVLVDRYPRDSYRVASKLPAYLARDMKDAHRMFFVSLEDLQIGYFDAFLLHNLGETRTRAFDDFGIWDFLLEQKKAGFIGDLGFSFHDKADELDRLLSLHPEIDFVQLQVNYADWESSAVESRRCLEVANAHNVFVVAMEPAKGGLLAQPPTPVEHLLRQVRPDVSPMYWALAFAALAPGIETVLSGMSTIHQMRENLSLMQRIRPFDNAECAAIEKARHMLATMDVLFCTSCGYCTDVCPKSVRIPAAISAYNILIGYGDMDKARESYVWASSGKASTCIQCGACEAVCPQHLCLVDALKKIASLFET